MSRKAAAITILSILLCGSTAVAQSTRWFHVNVQSGGPDGERVSVNIPLKLVETVLPMIEQKEFVQGEIELDELPLTVNQMREIWRTLQTEGDFELASIKDKDVNLRIYKEGDFLHVRSNENAKDKISINIPAAVVDALLSGESDELNITAAVKMLTQSDVDEIARIEDGEDTVRVWVDSNASLD
jgi:hypothetical protein